MSTKSKGTRNEHSSIRLLEAAGYPPLADPQFQHAQTEPARFSATATRSTHNAKLPFVNCNRSDARAEVNMSIPPSSNQLRRGVSPSLPPGTYFPCSVPPRATLEIQCRVRRNLQSFPAPGATFVSSLQGYFH